MVLAKLGSLFPLKKKNSFILTRNICDHYQKVFQKQKNVSGRQKLIFELEKNSKQKKKLKNIRKKLTQS